MLRVWLPAGLGLGGRVGAVLVWAEVRCRFVLAVVLADIKSAVEEPFIVNPFDAVAAPVNVEIPSTVKVPAT